MTQQSILEAHARLRAALREQPPDPAAQRLDPPDIEAAIERARTNPDAA